MTYEVYEKGSFKSNSQVLTHINFDKSVTGHCHSGCLHGNKGRRL